MSKEIKCNVILSVMPLAIDFVHIPHHPPPHARHLALNATYYLTNHNVDGTRTYTYLLTYLHARTFMYVRDGKGVWTGTESREGEKFERKSKWKPHW